jgi:L-threonylcarbamoyladenylate synthase
MTRCLSVDPQCPAVEVVAEAVRVLQRGSVVAYPTDTVYGLAVDATQPEAIARLYAVKGRPAAKAVLVTIGARHQLTPLITTLSATAEQLMAAFWPGPLTLLLPPHARVPAVLLGDSPCIGVRWPDAVLSQQLALQVGHAITASSANRSGMPPALSAAEVAAQLSPAVDLILDGGRLRDAAVSTVLDVTVQPPVLQRAGRIKRLALEAVLGYSIGGETALASESPLPRGIKKG